MILDRIDQLPLYASVLPGAERILEAFLQNAPEKAGAPVREKSYAAREDSARRFEVHGRTIDLMMVREGAEIIHICPCEGMPRAEALKDDGFKLEGGVRGIPVPVRAGWFCAILPGEAHMVGGRAEGWDGVVKWVVKVPAPDGFCREV